MNYAETKYHGTKKDLRRYLTQLKDNAIANVRKKYEPLLDEAKLNAMKKVGLTEYFEKDVKTLEESFNHLNQLLYKLEAEGIQYSTYGVLKLAYYKTDIENEMKQNIYFNKEKNYYKLNNQKQTEIEKLAQSWDPVLMGIVGQGKKVKYICKDLEEVGFDLTPYYEEQLKKSEVLKPSIHVNYKNLGID